MFGFIFTDLLKSYVIPWGMGSGVKTTHVLFVKDILVTLVAIFLSDLKTFWQRRSDVLLYFPSALLFSVSQNLAVSSLREVDPGTFKLTLQLCLPTTAILSWLILKVKYCSTQLKAIGLVFVTSCLFSLSRFSDQSSSSRGLVFTFGFVITSSLGMVLSEKMLKRHDAPPLAVSTLQMKLCSLLIGLLSVFTVPPGSAPWSYRVYVVIVVYAVSGFTVTYLSKRLSSTSKNVCQAASAVLAFLISYRDYTVPGLVTPMLVILSVAFYQKEVMVKEGLKMFSC